MRFSSPLQNRCFKAGEVAYDALAIRTCGVGVRAGSESFRAPPATGRSRRGTPAAPAAHPTSAASMTSRRAERGRSGRQNRVSLSSRLPEILKAECGSRLPRFVATRALVINKTRYCKSSLPHIERRNPVLLEFSQSTLIPCCSVGKPLVNLEITLSRESRIAFDCPSAGEFG